jgi:5'-nucleotidase / UDP-sugar diphosphatase
MKSVVLFSILLSLSTVACASAKTKPVKLTILHTNDHHGRFWPNKDGELGLAPRATLINQLRDEVQKDGGHVLLIDAGDVNTGIPQSDMQNAEPDFKGMALLGYDVMALGNHEFDKPAEVLAKQQEWAGFPFISANIYNKESDERVFPSHITKEIDGIKVTIFGLTTEDTPVKSNPKNTAHLKFVPAVEEAKRLVPILRKEADVLIALTHMGHYDNENHGADAPGDVTLARKVNGIDLIVGGHTQKPLFQPDIQNGAIIVQAHEWGKYVGRVDLEIAEGKVTLKDYKLIPVNLKTSEIKIEADAYVESVLRPFKDKGDASLSVELGSVNGELMGLSAVIRNGETNLGNLITRAYKEKFKADLALTNSGGIRASIQPGKITYETVLTVLPFGNQLAMADLTGAELISYLESVLFIMKGTGGFPQISGAEIVANTTEKKITSFKINGLPVDAEKKYLLALPEFTAAGGDKYPAIQFRKTGFVDADILKDFVLSKGAINVEDFVPTGYLKYE